MPRRRSSASPTMASSRTCSPPSPSWLPRSEPASVQRARPSDVSASGLFLCRQGAPRADGGRAMSYTAPVKDMLFCMKELAGLESIAQLPGLEEAGLETAQAVLEECARFCQEVLA